MTATGTGRRQHQIRHSGLIDDVHASVLLHRRNRKNKPTSRTQPNPHRSREICQNKATWANIDVVSVNVYA